MNTLKLISSSLCLALCCWSCGNSSSTLSSGEQQQDTATATAASGKLAAINFEESVFDFGKVKEGAIVEHTFSFTNTGESPLILNQVSASCGCTTPSYTHTPILPGKKGEVKVSFNSDGQAGQQQKIVTVVSNAEQAVVTVQIKGLVEAK